MPTWVRSFSSNLVGAADSNLVGVADLDTDTAPGDFEGWVTSVRFQYTVDVASGTFDDDQYLLQPVQIETSGGTQLATVAASGTLQAGTTSIAVDLTDNSPSTAHNATDWSGAKFDGVTSQIIASFSQNMKTDGVAVRILASSVTITITYNLGTPTATLVQTTARAYEDGGEPTGARYSSGEITGGNAPTLDAWPNGKTYLGRFEVEETAAVSANFQAQLQYSHNGGAWTAVTTSSSVVKAYPSAGIFDGDATTNRISSSAKTFQAGVYSDDGLAASVTGLSNEHTEVLFSFVIVHADVANTDSVKLRVRNNTTPEVSTWTQTLDITVNKTTPALPGMVHNHWSGFSGETWGWFGPHCDSNGNLYYFTEVGFWKGEATGQALPDGIAWKSADGGKSWQLTDMAGRPGANWRDLEGMDVARSHLGPNTTGELWLAHQSDSEGDLYVVPFRTSDHATNADTWGTVTNRAYTDGPGEEYSNIIERSDGDLVGIYGQTISATYRVVFDWQSAGTWQGQSASPLDNGGNNTHAKASLGNSDRVVVVVFDADANALDARNLPDNTATPGNVTTAINGAQTVKNFVGGVMEAGPIAGVLQYDSTLDKHLVIWMDNSDILRSVTLTWNSGTSTYDAGTPQQVSTTTVDHDFPTGADTTHVAASMAVDYATGDVYCTWIDPTNRAIHYAKWDGTWGSTTTLYTPSGNTDRASYVMPSVFTHSAGNGSAKVLGYVYTVCDITSGEGTYLAREARYNEVVLSAGTNATVTPATVNTVVAVPAPTVSTGSTVTPATVNTVVAVPAPTVSTGSTVTPATVNTVVAVPAPTVDTTEDATVTPASVAAATAVPAVSVSAGATTTPATINTVATVPAPTVETGTNATVTPATVNTVATIPAPTVDTTEDATVTPATVDGTATIPAPTVDTTSNATVTPATVNTVAAVPAPTVSTGNNATVNAATINTAATVPAPTVDTTSNATVTPGTVNTVATVPAPTVDTTSNATVTPATVNTTATVPAPTVDTTSNATVTPATVNTTVAVPAPAIATGITLTPATVNTTATVPAPSIATGSSVTVNAATITAVATTPAPTVDTTSNATVTPTTVNATATIPTPTVDAASPATITATTITATTAIPTPTIDTTEDVTVTPGATTATTTVNSATISYDYTWSVAAVSAPATVNTATISAGFGDSYYWLSFDSEPQRSTGLGGSSTVSSFEIIREQG